MAKTIKPVAFNDRHADEAAMLKHVRRKNFSGYVKKLIGEDMKAKTAPLDVQIEDVSDAVPKEMIHKPTSAERLERLKSPKPPLKPPLKLI